MISLFSNIGQKLKNSQWPTRPDKCRRGRHAKIFCWTKAAVKGDLHLMNKAVNTEIIKYFIIHKILLSHKVAKILILCVRE